jgi:hypothetical protein
MVGRRLLRNLICSLLVLEQTFQRKPAGGREEAPTNGRALDVDKKAVI